METASTLQGGLELILSVDGTAAQYLVPQELVSLAEAVKISDLQRCTSLGIVVMLCWPLQHVQPELESIRVRG